MSRLLPSLLLLVVLCACGEVRRPIGRLIAAQGDGGAGQGTFVPHDPTSSWPSSGCGKPLPDEQRLSQPNQAEGYTPYPIAISGETLAEPHPEYAQERTAWVRAPVDYDPSQPLRVVYLAEPCGKDDISSYKEAYPLFDESGHGADQALYVVIARGDADKVPPISADCYDDQSGASSIEWETFANVHAFVESNFCVDNSRVYVSGFSGGATLGNMLGCYFAGQDPGRAFSSNFSLRGQATVAGKLPTLPGCGGPVAGIWISDLLDTTDPIEASWKARDQVLSRNDCRGSSSERWGEGDLVSQLDCQRYVDCPANYPVVFCTSDDAGHGEQVDRAVAAFTQFFELMDPQP